MAGKPRDNRPIEPGTVFGRLTVLRQAESRNGKRYYLCRCRCGAERAVCGANLKNGMSTSCNKGACSGNAKLAAETVLAARRLHREGVPVPKIRERLAPGLSDSAVHHAVTGKRWSSLSAAPEPVPAGPGARIRAAREAAGIDRRELAGRLGVSYQRLADIEADRKPITLESVLGVAAALGMDPHALDDRLASRPVPTG